MTKVVGLSARQQRFVDEYVVDCVATQAAIRAGYSKRTANEQGARLLAKASVQTAVAASKAKLQERTGITAEAVVTRLWMIATADPRELIEYRRTCCRYCYGIDHNYHFTRHELITARAKFEAAQAKKSVELFDEQGGDGYNGTREPNTRCPECFGEGVERPFVHDTRKLSPAALALYAGVKTTKDGLEVKMHDQAAALFNVGKHLGLFAEKPETTDDDAARAKKIREDLDAMDLATVPETL